jgi:hypothetical protein
MLNSSFIPHLCSTDDAGMGSDLHALILPNYQVTLLPGLTLHSHLKKNNTITVRHEFE